MNNVGKGRPRTVQRRVHPIAVQLRTARIGANMSQQTLADRLGYSVDTIKRWKLGRYHPTLYHLVDWCDALGHELMVRPGYKMALAENIPYPDKAQLMGGGARAG